MKLNYYSYYVKHLPSGQKYAQPIDSFLRAFSSYNNNSLKNDIIFNGRNYYLLNPVGNLFLFLQTSSADLIKRVNRQDITAADLVTLLAADESIAFASYIYFENLCFGIASPSSAPKVQSLCNFINRLLELTGNQDYQLVVTPLLIQEASREEVLDLDFMGKVTIEIGVGNSLAEHIMNFFGADIPDFADLSSIEVILKPRRKRNIKHTVSSAINSIPDDELQKFIVAAKQDVNEKLTEYYIEGKGIIHDIISISDENTIASNIRDKMQRNMQLHERLGVQNEEITHQVIANIGAFSQLAAWSGVFDDVQVGN